MTVELRHEASVDAIDAAAWDALVSPDDPFCTHAFLSALERSGSVGDPRTGWIPRPLTLWDGDELVGAAPVYEKLDSYGEYIFDWAWADAALRAGIPYYPKLVCAVPFTPAGGPRLLVAPGPSAATRRAALAEAMATAADEHGAWSTHVLFCGDDEAAALEPHGFVHRLSHQFHWLREPGWATFDDFLGALRASSRKQIRRERRRAAEHGFELVVRRGPALRDQDWKALDRFYRRTTRRYGARAYLRPAFFGALREAAPELVVATLALRDDEPVAGALFLQRGASLFGRYWGCDPDLEAPARGDWRGAEPPDHLHFELCYYLPIEWALDQGITRFEAGAQGAHKIRRGLLPRLCHSAHQLRVDGLHDAVAGFVASEALDVRAQVAALMRHTPFKRS